jgi:hypothetical protein
VKTQRPSLCVSLSPTLSVVRFVFPDAVTYPRSPVKDVLGLASWAAAVVAAATRMAAASAAGCSRIGTLDTPDTE